LFAQEKSAATIGAVEKIRRKMEVLTDAKNDWLGRLNFVARALSMTMTEMNFIGAAGSKSLTRLQPSIAALDWLSDAKNSGENERFFGRNLDFLRTASLSYSQLVAAQGWLCTTYCVFLFTGFTGFDWIAKTRLCISKILRFLALSPLRTRRR
jgi:hypothetical protein